MKTSRYRPTKEHKRKLDNHVMARIKAEKYSKAKPLNESMVQADHDAVLEYINKHGKTTLPTQYVRDYRMLSFENILEFQED